ncbi:cupin domain-containing protein [Campylobacter upsaliensis]|uniref:cupin domain-containing protein n=1 Tax=Campylobacter upsaliensis TaxID=28080 RepID=UPI0022EAD699|nr:cupin domain-containing protein [Campylobacter upsaliensis]MEB2806005.1 cupin domain-containing protein [Campylobacter upsaliensis]
MRIGKIVFASMLAVCFAQGEKSMQEITKEAKEMKGDSRIFSGARVHFSPKARSAWHTHPAGQTLIVTQGVIYTGTKNGIVHKAETGESIACPPNVDHWHGAGLESSGTHIALTQYSKDSNVVWGDKLSDEEYLQAIKQAEKRK